MNYLDKNIKEALERKKDYGDFMNMFKLSEVNDFGQEVSQTIKDFNKNVEKLDQKVKNIIDKT